jgi:CubicO group peptidase (beta-lactamase class C family)
VKRLQRLDTAMQQVIDDGQLAGMSLLVARHGQVVHAAELGKRDLVSGAPMTRDSIVRAYSMTKPVTGVAMMMLYEEGRWSPSDPITRFIPQFAGLKVYAGLDAEGRPRYEAPRHVPTLGELMSHTAGFAYGLSASNPVDVMYQKAQPLQAASASEMIDRIAKLPLAYQPGTQWQYSASVDIQGYIVEKLSGMTLAQFMQQRIFGPLGMKDTAFAVPADKLARLATIYTMGADGKLAALPRAPDVSQVPGFASGGGGLYSTANDYLRFAQMLANQGQLDGVRLLAPRTIALMRSNHLAPELTRGGFGIGLQQLRPGFGFGYDVAVFEDPYLAGSVIGKGSYLWDGAAGTWFWVDPENDVVVVGMIQRMSGGPGAYPRVQETARPLVYQALME